jgi:hypothetical protein
MGTMPPYISAQLAIQLTPSKAKTPIPTLATCALDMVENEDSCNQKIGLV